MLHLEPDSQLTFRTLLDNGENSGIIIPKMPGTTRGRRQPSLFNKDEIDKERLMKQEKEYLK